MKVVTGASGFIGSHIVPVVPDGVPVDPDVDLADTDALTAAFRGADVVFHLAAQADVMTSVGDPIGDARTNILGTLSVLQACVDAGVPRVVYAASGGTMDDQRSPYGISKAAVLPYLAWYGDRLRWVALALGNVYGPGGHGVVEAFLRERPIIYGDGSAVRDFVHVDDVARAFVMAGEHGSGIIPIGTGVGTTIRDLAALCSDADPVYRPARPYESDVAVMDPRTAGWRLGWTARIPLATGVRQARTGVGTVG